MKNLKITLLLCTFIFFSTCDFIAAKSIEPAKNFRIPKAWYFKNLIFNKKVENLRWEIFSQNLIKKLLYTFFPQRQIDSKSNNIYPEKFTSKNIEKIINSEKSKLLSCKY